MGKRTRSLRLFTHENHSKRSSTNKREKRSTGFDPSRHDTTQAKQRNRGIREGLDSVVVVFRFMWISVYFNERNKLTSKVEGHNENKYIYMYMYTNKVLHHMQTSTTKRTGRKLKWYEGETNDREGVQICTDKNQQQQQQHRSLVSVDIKEMTAKRFHEPINGPSARLCVCVCV